MISLNLAEGMVFPVMAFVLQETSEQEEILADHAAEVAVAGDTVHVTHDGFYRHLTKLWH